MFEPGIETWAGCGLDQLPRSRFFRSMHERRAPQSVDLPGEPGYAEGYAQGLRDGAAAQAEADTAHRATLATLIERMEAAARLPAGSVELLLTEAARRIADAIEGELDVASGAVGQLIARLADGVDSEHAIVAAHVHPADALAGDGPVLPFPIEVDEAVAQGCVRLRVDGGWIDDGPAVRLARFRARLDRQAGP